MSQGNRSSTTLRKKQIMDAARKLIMSSGSEHVTVRNMAREVGITEPTIYRHFRSKTEILSFLVDNVATGLLGDIEMAGNVVCNSLDAIGESLKIHLSKIEQKKGISFLVLAEIISFGDKSLNKKVLEILLITQKLMRPRSGFSLHLKGEISLASSALAIGPQFLLLYRLIHQDQLRSAWLIPHQITG